MVIVVTGGTGLVGLALIERLLKEKHTVYNITRKSRQIESAYYKEFLWPECSDKFPIGAVPKKMDYGVINLAGEPVFLWPWTKKRKEKIYSSRVNRTQHLVSALKEHPPQFFVSASAIGIYGEQGERVIQEDSQRPQQNFFLQKVCLDWEEAALRASSMCRTVILRLGIVLSYKKGFLYKQNQWITKRMLPFIITSKEHWFSWISIEDIVSLILWAVKNEQTKGIYNAVSPQPVTLKQLYCALKKQNKSAWLPLIPLPSPLFLLKKAGGEMFQNLLMNSKVIPAKALSEGFVFKQADLEMALKQLFLEERDELKL